MICAFRIVCDLAFVAVVAWGLWNFALSLFAAESLWEHLVVTLKLLVFLSLSIIVWKALVEVWVQRKIAEYTAGLGEVSTTRAGLLKAVGILVDETAPRDSEKRLNGKHSESNPESLAEPMPNVANESARSLSLDELQDGDVMCIELVAGDQERRFVCLHPYKTHDVTYFRMMYGGHLLTVQPLVEAPDKAHYRYMFQIHRYGTAGGLTLRSLCSNTFLTSFEHRFSKLDDMRVVAWHQDRSSKVLTTFVDVFNPPNGGVWEQWVLREAKQVDSNVEGGGPVFTLGREKEYWRCLGPDVGVGLTRNVGDASAFRLHLVSRSDRKANQKLRMGALLKEDKKAK
uniref:Uncharacterized protein n=1 Tax=Pyramimonas obovata TaxID=1411642 RepID=A0A7S0MZZ6_9CHLO